MKQPKSQIRIDTPATYCIHLQGILDDSWSDRLGGMSIQMKQKTGEAPVTILNGRLLDQAELSGILNCIYDLGYPLLKVKCLDD